MFLLEANQKQEDVFRFLIYFCWLHWFWVSHHVLLLRLSRIPHSFVTTAAAAANTRTRNKMGKKATGSKKRAIQRGTIAAKEILEGDAKVVEEHHVTSQTDHALFVLDTDAVDVKALQVPVVAAKRTKQRGLAKRDEQKVLSLVATKTKEELEEAVAMGRLERLRRSKRTIGNCRPGFDLWGGGEDVKKQKIENISGIGMSLAGTAPAHTKKQPSVAKKSTYKAVALQVAHSGQSYHPDPTQHQDVIGEALALELRRKEADDYNAAPISAGLSEETKALLVGSDDEEESEEDNDDDNDEVLVQKKKDKLTRAQRNKQKRHRAELKEIFERKQAKKLLNSVAELKKYSKELSKKQIENKEQKAVIKILKEQTERTLGKDVFQHLSEKDPSNVPSLPVALTSELSSSLRTVKPKGSLVEDRFESFRDRKMADRHQLGDRKKVVQGKKRKVKVKGQVKHKFKGDDGGDYLLMG
jgi:hypothetical protein